MKLEIENINETLLLHANYFLIVVGLKFTICRATM